MPMETIMHECIMKLLQEDDEEESLECLCKLLKTIGKELEQKWSKNSSTSSVMEQYFSQLEEFVDWRLTSSRVRFMLQDVIDLRRNNWIPETRPDQIHKDAEKEACEQQQEVYETMISNYGRKTSGRKDRWNPSSRSNKGHYSMVDPSKLKLTKPEEVESIRLGPGRKGLQSWGRGIAGGNKTSAESDVMSTLTNRYSAVADQSMTPSYENERGSQVKKNNETLLNGKEVESTVLILKGPEYSEDDLVKKTKPVIDVFLLNADFEEAIKCVTELVSLSTVNYFIYSAINQVLERSSQARCLLGQLFYSLVQKGLISLDQYKKGLSAVLENVNDLDTPLIWEYMGEILEPMVDENKFHLTFLKDALEPCIPSLTAGKLVSEVIHCAAKRKGTIKLGELWRESELQWTDFLGSSSNITEFISSHNLDFTVSPTKGVPMTQLTDAIQTQLKDILANSKSDGNEKIFEWIDAIVPQSTISEPFFVRALTTAVLKSAISGIRNKYELNTETLKKRNSLLMRYIGHIDNLELQALYAVQRLINDLGQPKGVLRQIFDILYDDDVITQETFKQWENSTDSNEAEGKGTALLSVRGFFIWLESTDDIEIEED